jgi:oligopeptide transport system permease protein
MRDVWTRLWQAPLVLWAIITLSFIMTRLAPGSPFGAGERALDPAVLKTLEVQYGLDGSIWTQYWRYMFHLLQGDLGPSLHQQHQSVATIIAAHLPFSLMLGGLTLLIAVIAGTWSGTVAARFRNGPIDYGVMALALATLSIPAFVLGPWLQWWLNQALPVAGYEVGWLGLPNPIYLILPVAALAAPIAGRLARLVRASVLEVQAQDHVRTALAKGLSAGHIRRRHIVRGALVPMVAYLGPAAASLLTGSLVIEQIFDLPGIGKKFVQAAFNRDYTLVLGTVIVYSVILMLCNLISDLLVLWLDPRSREAHD